MHVSGFMVPAQKVATCRPGDTIKSAVDEMVAKHIGAIVVLKSDCDMPLGIVTKTDLVEAYQKGVTLDHNVSEVMSQELQTIRQDQSRDQAARVFERSKKHHLIVLNAENEFVGFISSWDIATECARDDRAWPWIRPESGKFQASKHDDTPASPRSTVEHVRADPNRSSYLQYIDSIRNCREMDD